MSLDTLNGIEFLGAHIKWKVPGYKEKVDGHVYYQIVVSYTLKEPIKRQDMWYTYDRCLSLSQRLQRQCPDLPGLPAPSMFGFKPMAQEIERRRIDIEKWLMAITWRCDVLCTSDYQEFCDLSTLIGENWLDVQTPSVELSQGHLFPVSDFHYDHEQQVCFIATTDQSLLSKMSGIVNLFTGLGKSPSKVQSQLLGYRLDIDDQGEPRTKQLWKNTYIQKITCICWDEKLTILVVGFEGGSIMVLRISSEKGFSTTTEFCNVVKHTDSINGLATNSITGQMYSIAKDRCLITTDLSNPNNVLKEKQFPQELTCMFQDRNTKRLFVGDSVGDVFIFHYEAGFLEAAHHIQPLVKMTITCLSYYPNKNYLIVGSKEGVTTVYDVQRHGKERLTALVTTLNTIPNQRALVFSGSSKELYINYNSNIVVFDSQKVKPIYTIQAHNGGVTKMELYEDLHLIVSGGEDGSLKFWQYKDFTHQVINRDVNPLRGSHIQKVIHQEEENPFELKQKRIPMKPQLDDLDGWNV